jgi:hypothetical protein
LHVTIAAHTSGSLGIRPRVGRPLSSYACRHKWTISHVHCSDTTRRAFDHVGRTGDARTVRHHKTLHRPSFCKMLSISTKDQHFMHRQQWMGCAWQAAALQHDTEVKNSHKNSQIRRRSSQTVNVAQRCLQWAGNERKLPCGACNGRETNVNCHAYANHRLARWPSRNACPPTSRPHRSPCSRCWSPPGDALCERGVCDFVEGQTVAVIAPAERRYSAAGSLG